MVDMHFPFLLSLGRREGFNLTIRIDSNTNLIEVNDFFLNLELLLAYIILLTDHTVKQVKLASGSSTVC